MITHIELNNMRFFSYHGVLKQERMVGNNFVVNVKLCIDFTKSFLTDNIADTISYADVYSVVKEEMEIPSSLIEHVGGRIFKSIKNRFKNISNLEVRLRKNNPPISAEIESCEIVISDF